METKCTAGRLRFHELGRREVVVNFAGGAISSDGGALLLREIEQRSGILQGFAKCFHDDRDRALIEHTVEERVSQRVYALALGYEDVNDHDELRLDPLLAVVVGKADPKGLNRIREQGQGKPLAGKSTLNRLELTPAEANAASRYKKIVAKPEAIDEWLVSVFLQSYEQPPSRIVLEAVLKMSRAPPEQGARQRESAVYKGVPEHFELPRNAAMASAVVFKTVS